MRERGSIGGMVRKAALATAVVVAAAGLEGCSGLKNGGDRPGPQVSAHTVVEFPPFAVADADGEFSHLDFIAKASDTSEQGVLNDSVQLGVFKPKMGEASSKFLIIYTDKSSDKGDNAQRDNVIVRAEIEGIRANGNADQVPSIKTFPLSPATRAKVVNGVVTREPTSEALTDLEGGRKNVLVHTINPRTGEVIKIARFENIVIPLAAK